MILAPDTYDGKPLNLRSWLFGLELYFVACHLDKDRGETGLLIVHLWPLCYIEVHLLGIVFYAKGCLQRYLEPGLK